VKSIIIIIIVIITKRLMVIAYSKEPRSLSSIELTNIQVICGWFDNYVGVLVTCVLAFIAFWYCFVYVDLFLFVTCLRTTATEYKLK